MDALNFGIATYDLPRLASITSWGMIEDQHEAFVEELNDQDGSLDNLSEFATTDTSGTSVVFADWRRHRLRGEC